MTHMDTSWMEQEDTVDSTPVSVYLWIPFIWYAIAATRSITFWVPGSGNRTGIDLSYTEGSSVDRAIYSVLIAAGIWVLIRKRIPWSHIARCNMWVIAILVYSLISMLWSDFPEVLFKRWVKLFGSIVMSLIVLTEPAPVEAISTLLRRCLLIHIPLDIVLVKYFRNIGVGWDDMGIEMWTGLTKHKNVLGQVCMVGGLYFIWDSVKKLGKRRCLVNIFYLAMIGYLMNGPGGSRSITAILVLFIGLLIFFGLRFAPRDKDLLNRFLIKGAIALIFVMASIQFGFSAFTGDRSLVDVTLKASGKDTTLTGRTELWEDILVYASRNPVQGVGYGSFWIGDQANNLWERHYWKPKQGHNGYIDVYVELGMIGLVLMGGLLVSVFVNVRDAITRDFEFGRFQMALFVMVVIHNFAESSFLRGDNDVWFIFLLVAMNMGFPASEGVPETSSLIESAT